MGHVNLIKANFTGKVGQLVGAKWKNKSTIRSFTKPAYTNTPAQQIIRRGFKALTSYIALFADQLKSLSALNLKGMSLRNAIIRMNKDMITEGELFPEKLLISRGGLPSVSGVTATANNTSGIITVAFTPAQGATISDNATVVAVAVSQANNFAAVGTGKNSSGIVAINCGNIPRATISIHYYLVDYRGSSRVGSMSDFIPLDNL
jgi:hypothetical protein